MAVIENGGDFSVIPRLSFLSLNKLNASQPTFRGYDAAPLKGIYMGADMQYGVVETFEQVEKVCKRENINLGMLAGGELYSETNQLPEKIESYDGYGTALGVSKRSDERWVQDIRGFFKAGEKEILGTFGHFAAFEHDNTVRMAESIQAAGESIEAVSLKSQLQGGDFFLFPSHPKTGRPFAIVGTVSVEKTIRYLAADELGIDPDNPAVASYAEEKHDRLEKDAKALILADLHLNNPKDVFYISSPNFHLDMAIRPIGAPRVLLHDPALSLELLETLKSKATREDTRKTLDKMISETRYYFDSLGEKYASVETVKKELKAAGLTDVIRMPGIFGSVRRNLKTGSTPKSSYIELEPRPLVDYLNATVHQRPDGSLVYITQSFDPQKTAYFVMNRHSLSDINFDAVFEEFLRSRVNNIAQVDFILGGPMHSTLTDVMANRDGGLHCIMSEWPDFGKWLNRVV